MGLSFLLTVFSSFLNLFRRGNGNRIFFKELIWECSRAEVDRGRDKVVI